MAPAIPSAVAAPGMAPDEGDLARLAERIAVARSRLPEVEAPTPEGRSARDRWCTGWALVLWAVVEIVVGLHMGGEFQVVTGLLILLDASLRLAHSVQGGATPWRDRL